uniref:Uncharacterized protein n=1 Tax=Kalanchoe fedtschenkoi TaxID=63787 RepID=A0A7N0UKJ1_KALFE
MEVKIASEIWLRPSSTTPPHLRHYRLSLLDQLIPVDSVPFIFFYKHDELINLNQKLDLLKNKLSQILSDFYVLAGKMMEDGLTVDCNDDGVRYVEARVDCEMREFLARPDLLQMNKLVPSRDVLKMHAEGTHVASIQINVFKCESLAIGLSISHKIVDGAGIGVFMNAWAAAARRSVDYSNPKPNFNTSSVFPAENLWLKEVAAAAVSSVKPGSFITKRLGSRKELIAHLQTDHKERVGGGAFSRGVRCVGVSTGPDPDRTGPEPESRFFTDRNRNRFQTGLDRTGPESPKNTAAKRFTGNNNTSGGERE